MKIGKYILPLLFSVFLILPTVNQVFELWEFESEDENRATVDSVVFDINKLDAFPEHYEAYYNDQFSFKPLAVNIMSKLKKELFNVSINSEAYLGEDNFVFSAGTARFTIGKDYLNLLQRIRLEEEWLNRLNYFKEKNIEAYWFIIPSKSDIYFEKLPWNLKLNQYPSVGDLIMLNDNFNHVYYLKEVMLEGKRKGKVFYKADTHWTPLGASITYNEMVKVLNENGHQLSLMNALKRIDYGANGNLRNNIPSHDFEEELEKEVPFDSLYQELEAFGFPADPNFPYPEFYEFHYESKWKKASDKKVLIIRDSFTNFIQERLATNFKESLFIWDNWKYQLNPHIIEYYKPDIVIYICSDNIIPNMVKL